MADHGGFIWYELMTDDLAGAKAFYGDVVGWTIAEDGMTMPNGTRYRMIGRSDGGFAGGVLEITPDMAAHGSRPMWIGYIHHSDVDGAVREIEQAGGQVHVPPTEMEGVGRMAMVTDPYGAPFYVMNPTPPADQPDATSDVFDYEKAQHVRWNELWTPDQDGAVALYSRLFGWTQEGAMDMGPMGQYLFIQHDGGGIGAIARAGADGPGPRWTYFIGVDDIDRAVAAARAGGGTLDGEPMQVPGGEYTIYARDPQGAAFGLVGPRKES